MMISCPHGFTNAEKSIRYADNRKYPHNIPHTKNIILSSDFPRTSSDFGDRLGHCENAS